MSGLSPSPLFGWFGLGRGVWVVLGGLGCYVAAGWVRAVCPESGLVGGGWGVYARPRGVSCLGPGWAESGLCGLFGCVPADVGCVCWPELGVCLLPGGWACLVALGAPGLRGHQAAPGWVGSGVTRLGGVMVAALGSGVCVATTGPSRGMSTMGGLSGLCPDLPRHARRPRPGVVWAFWVGLGYCLPVFP